MTFHLKKKKNQKNIATKMKHCTTSEFISSDISFEKKIKKFTTKIKLYTTSEFISNETSFQKQKISL